MTDAVAEPEWLGTWAKRYYYANRAAIDIVLRGYGVGSTQWAVLYQLAHDGPTAQRDLAHALHIERASLSGIIAALVRKGLVEQAVHETDQRQRLVTLTAEGRTLWEAIPDPFELVRSVALEGIDPDELATAVRVLRTATMHVDAHAFEAT